jgi:HSP20 family molecular chaperone IbpA
VFRRLDLPAPINPDKVTANLDHGVLQLTEEKASHGNRIRTNAA